jgi:hypothetical protein
MKSDGVLGFLGESVDVTLIHCTNFLSAPTYEDI